MKDGVSSPAQILYLIVGVSKLMLYELSRFLNIAIGELNIC